MSPSPMMLDVFLLAGLHSQFGDELKVEHTPHSLASAIHATIGYCNPRTHWLGIAALRSQKNPKLVTYPYILFIGV